MSHDPVETNYRSNARPFAAILEQRLSRRNILASLPTASSAGVLAGFGLVGCSNSSDSNTSTAARPAAMSFTSVAKSTANNVQVPTGYSARVLYAKGDPINNNVPEYANDGSDMDFEQRAGDEHDGMYYFGLSDSGLPDNTASTRGLLCMNHENLEDTELHPNGPTAAADNGGSRPEAEVRKEMNAHGVSIVEVVDDGNGFRVNRSSGFNRRITAFTEMDIRGPVRGDTALVTPFSNGTETRGTLNNCANGFTPWGTYLTCEENWFGYWNRGDDETVRNSSDNELLAAYGIGAGSRGFANREWDTVNGEAFARFDVTAAADGNGNTDWRNEQNNFGYVVEIDPFDPQSRPQKRTALGRFAHEGCWIGPVTAGEPLVFYMGDDSRNEYIYKFVSDAKWNPEDATGGLEIGDKYMDSGKLYAARFNADGSGDWLHITFGTATDTATGSDYVISSLADALLGTRIVADRLGATPMDRPEWAAVDPITGETYMTLTNSSSGSSGRGQGGSGSEEADAANPRSYVDGGGNRNGHIIRWRETTGNASTTFMWDIYLFGADSDIDDDGAATDTDNINISRLTDSNDFSSPDGLYFDSRGILWIQTDDGAFNETNDQLLAALPGTVGDGVPKAVTSATNDGGSTTVMTFAGQDASDNNLRRFLVGPQGCEITGITFTPDHKTLFVNVQHPSSPASGAWPALSGVATDDGDAGRGRSATVVITRDDGGEIAL